MINNKPLGLRARLARFLMGSDFIQREAPPAEQEAKSSVTGSVLDELNRFARPFFELSTKRKEVYRDVTEMDDTVDEVTAALDILADNAVCAEGGSQQFFTIAYEDESAVPAEAKAAIEGVIRRTNIQELAYQIVRDALQFGDCFVQPVVNEEMLVTRLMFMPQSTMVRNEDEQGRLRDGNTPGYWAFEQIIAGEQPVGFYPWQIIHFRWNRRGRGVYGRSLLYTARTAWKKLQAMEEALVINWLTRAFARLLFILDTTGKSDSEAKTYIDNFKRALLTQRIGSGVDESTSLSVVKDIFIGRGYTDVGGKPQEGLTDVKVLDTTSTAFVNLDPIDYYRGKILTSLRVPKAHLGLEKDINAKATLVLQDRRFSRTVRRVQSMGSIGVRQLIDLQLTLADIDPDDVKYLIMWPSPAWSDATDDAAALKNYADADTALQKMGVVDTEYVAINHLHMPQTQWKAVRERAAAERKQLQAEATQALKDAAAVKGAQGNAVPKRDNASASKR